MDNNIVLLENDLKKQWLEVMSNSIGCKLPMSGTLKLSLPDSDIYALIEIDNKKSLIKAIVYDKNVWNYIVNAKFIHKKKFISFENIDDISEYYVIALDDDSKKKILEIKKCYEYVKYNREIFNVNE